MSPDGRDPGYPGADPEATTYSVPVSLSMRSPLAVAVRLWLVPLLLCWRCYLCSVLGYLLVSVGVWALAAGQADLIASTADARELVRRALLSAGPGLTALLLLGWLMVASVREVVAGSRSRRLGELRYVVGALNDAARRLAPVAPISPALRAGRYGVVVAALIAASLALGAALDAAFAAASIDTREGPGWLLRWLLYVYAITPLAFAAGFVGRHWAAPPR